MSFSLLKRLTQNPPAEDFALKPARVHEVEGAGQVAFALFQMLRHKGPIFWLGQKQQAHLLMPWGLPKDLAERLHLVEAKDEDDLLWATEETLRAAPVGLVVALPQKPLTLTIGRRLQLAAEAGQTIGLLLIAEGQGSNAAESRWHCSPHAGEGDSTLQHWRLTKNKSGTLKDWILDFHVASAAGHRISKACQ